MRNLVAATAIALATTLSAPITATAATPDRLTIVTAGDSTVAGAGTTSRRFGWPGRLHRRNLNTIDVTNVGHSASCLVADGCGHAGGTLLSTFRKEVLSLRPDIAIVSIGRNDLCHVSTEKFIAAAKTLGRDAEAVGVDLHFGTIAPVNERWKWPCEEQAAEINEELRRLPGTIDFAAALANHQGELPKRYECGDGLHPNGDGYRVMARAVEDALLR